MRPEVEARSPERRFASVVLPAPLGPLTAWIWSVKNSSETSFTAASPPKCLERRSVRSTASAIALLRRFSQQPGREPPEAEQAVRKQQHGEHDEPAHEQLPVLADVHPAHDRQPLESELEQHHGESAEDRAVQRSHTAQDHHHEHASRLMPAEDIGTDEAELGGGEITCHACERARDHEARELVAESAIAERAHA